VTFDSLDDRAPLFVGINAPVIYRHGYVVPDLAHATSLATAGTTIRLFRVVIVPREPAPIRDFLIAFSTTLNPALEMRMHVRSVNA
jgi:hypothetical protein